MGDLEELRERFTYATNQWSDPRAARKQDMLAVAGDPWDPKDRSARVDAGRPCLSLDEMGQYFNQVINDVLANPRAVKFDPGDKQASDAGAQFYGNKMREIEYRSQAPQIVYPTAFEAAVQGSYGWVRVKTGYTDEESDDQEISVGEVVNPDCVTADPDGVRPNSSDANYLYYTERWRIDTFKKRFPKASIHDFGDAARTQPLWIQQETLTLAEYWSITTQRVAKPHLRRGYADVPVVTMQLTNGVEILEETAWPGSYIPFSSCFGKVLYVDSGSGPKRILMSMTRLARDPAMLYNYYRTTQAELVGMTPRTPFVGYVGQFRTHSEDWQKAAHQPVAYLEADPLTTATGAQILPLPIRQPYDPPIERLEVGAEGARRAIQAAMGVSPLPTEAQTRNQKSGVALERINQSSQRGSFHFVHHYDAMIQHVGVIVEDLIDKIYDTARDVAVRKANEQAETVRINDPAEKEPISTKGKYLVTISTGPSYDSDREKAEDFADKLIGIGDPEIQRTLLPKVIKLKNLGPIGDELEALAKTLQPPAAQAVEAKDKPDAQQLMQIAGQMQQRIQMAEQVIKELEDERKGKVVEQQGKLALSKQESERDILLAEIQSDLAVRLQQMKDENAVLVATINAGKDEQKTAVQARVKGVELAHASVENERDREHEEDMAAANMGHAAASDQAGRDFAADEAERGRQATAAENDASREAASKATD